MGWNWKGREGNNSRKDLNRMEGRRVELDGSEMKGKEGVWNRMGGKVWNRMK
jgi:hypothetical protein